MNNDCHVFPIPIETRPNKSPIRGADFNKRKRKFRLLGVDFWCKDFYAAGLGLTWTPAGVYRF